MDYLLGRNPVLEALRAGRPINKLLIAKGANITSMQEILALAKKRNILVQYVEKKQLDYLAAGENHQGIMAQGAAKEYVEWDEVLETVQERGEVPLFLLLDCIEDPHNLGAILRTADACGVHCVIIPKHRAVPLTAGVAKASAGAIEYVNVSRVTNLSQTIDDLKKKGFWIAGTDQDAEQIYFEADLQGPLGIVMGSEGKGLSKLVKEKCDFLIGIPMKGQVNSLNVSVAASLVMYEVIRQRSSRENPTG